MRHALVPTVHMLITDGQNILLSRRFNTGWGDGKYGVPAGHIERGERVIQAAIREAKEEIGIDLIASEVKICHVMHRRSDDERIDFFVQVMVWHGQIRNCEPNKCDDLRWFPRAELPQNMVAYVEAAILSTEGGPDWEFSEFGWD